MPSTHRQNTHCSTLQPRASKSLLSLLSVFALATATLLTPSVVFADTTVVPERVGMSGERLARLGGRNSPGTTHLGARHRRPRA